MNIVSVTPAAMQVWHDYCRAGLGMIVVGIWIFNSKICKIQKLFVSLQYQTIRKDDLNMIKSDYIKTYLINEDVSYMDVFSYLERAGHTSIVDDKNKTIYMTRFAFGSLVGGALVYSDIWMKVIPARGRRALTDRVYDIYMNIDKSKTTDIIALQFIR